MRRILGLFVLFPLLLAIAGALHSAGPADVPAESAPDGGADDSRQTPDRPAAAPSAPVMTEHVEVTATRLADAPESQARVPAHVTVIEGRALEAGEFTIQDLLSLVSSAVAYDQVGNGLQTTFDLRGFNRGTGTKVYLDGAPLNDPRNNVVPLDLVPLDALERVEITRGSSSAVGGGGSEAGVIRLRSARGPDRLAGNLSVAGGSFGTSRVSGRLGAQAGKVDFAVAGSWLDTDGFRVNSGGDLGRLSGSLGIALPGGRRVEASVVDARSDLGSPGALTLAEFEEDPSQAFNTSDFFDQRLGQTALNFSGTLAGRFSAAANVFYRELDTDSLSTGRSGGTYSLDTSGSVAGTTFQLTRERRGPDRGHELVFGVEWLEGQTDATGQFVLGSSADDSTNTADNRSLGLFFQDTAAIDAHWSVMVGARADDQNIAYRETLPATISESKDYSEISFRGGVNWNPSDRNGFYLSYGEAFLPPTVEQLFAFPLFGSNPDLQPVDSRTYELGYRGSRGDRLRAEATLFVVDTDNEIVFVPDPDDIIGGRNRNAGKIRRRGLEAGLRGRVGSGLDWFADLTWTDAEFANGADQGNTVPLVPRTRAAAGFDAALPAGFRFRMDGLFVGSQVLDNDDANSGPRLPSYTTVDARVQWSAASHASNRPARGLTVFVEAANLLDRDYATRGILVFDFAALDNVVYLTPAPRRRWMAGAEWGF